jgi:hypothetical protein
MIGAGLFGLSGLAAYITPRGNLKQYGVDDPDPTSLAMMRCVGAWQMGEAAMILAPLDTVHALSSYAAARRRRRDPPRARAKSPGDPSPRETAPLS